MLRSERSRQWFFCRFLNALVAFDVIAGPWRTIETQWQFQLAPDLLLAEFAGESGQLFVFAGWAYLGVGLPFMRLHYMSMKYHTNTNFGYSL